MVHVIDRNPEKLASLVCGLENPIHGHVAGGRAGEPEDIAEVVAFLACSANRFICGETVVASGGEIMN